MEIYNEENKKIDKTYMQFLKYFCAVF